MGKYIIICDKAYLCELLWTASPRLLSVHSKGIHGLTSIFIYPYFPHENHHGVKAHDWQLSWLMSVLIGRRSHPTALFPTDITVDTLAANDFNHKRLPPGSVDIQAWASLWYKWRQVIHLYVVSVELSAHKYHPCCTELHITALHPIPWERIHIPHNLEEAEDGWKDRGMEGWTSRIYHQKRPDNNCEFWKRDIFNWLSILLMVRIGIIDSPQTQACMSSGAARDFGPHEKTSHWAPSPKTTRLLCKNDLPK